MDPISLSATCIALISTAASTTVVITKFVRDVRAARGDLDVVSRELLSLKTVLELLADDIANPSNGEFPETLMKQISGIVLNCTGIVSEIEQTLQKHEGTKVSKAAKWVISGKDDVSKLQSSLEAHKSALEIALDMVTLTVAKEIKVDTEMIRNDASAIKEDTSQILAEIARLQQQLPQDTNQPSTTGFMLERYLDNLTSYAETVCDSLPGDITAAEHELTESNPIRKKISATTSGTSDKEAQASESDSDSNQQRDKNIESLLKSSQSPHVKESAESTSKPHQDKYQERSDSAISHLNREPLATANDMRYQSNSLALERSVTLEEMNIGREFLFNCKLTLNYPIPERILSKVYHAPPPERDEFTHTRYTAANCDPSEFSSSGFVLRPSLFAKKRQTQILISIIIDEVAVHEAHQQKTSLAQTLASIQQSIEYLGRRTDTAAFGATSWKSVVVCFIAEAPENHFILISILSMFEAIGVYMNLKELIGTGRNLPKYLQDKPLQAGIFEYTTQLMPHFYKDSEFTTLGPGMPIQVILCVQPGNESGESGYSVAGWLAAIERSLQPRICVSVEAGMKVDGKTIYEMWNQRQNSPEHARSSGSSVIIQYKESHQTWWKFLRRD